MLKKDWKFALSRWGRFSLSPLLLLNGGYNWDLCASELYKKGYFIWGQLNDSLENWQDKKNANPGLSGKILHQLEKSDVFRKNFTEEHIDFYPLLKDKISLFLEKVVPASLRAFEKTGRLIEKNRFKGVLFSSNPTAISKSIAHAAKKAGVPVIGWQHGDMNTKQLFAIVLNDLLMSDLFLGWGRGANENRHETACQLKLERKQEIAGSAMLDKLISANPPLRSKILEKMGLKESSQKIIVYATTMYYSSNPYNFSWQHWSDNHLYDTQKRITSRMAGLEGSKIIKLHPNLFYASPAMEEYCLSYKEKNVHTVRSEVSAPELFSIADAIIVDSPSTTLLQAVCRNKPVFCLLRHPKLEGKIIDVLGKRAVLSEDPDRLMREVELFFESGKYKADLNNREFLESYGTNSDCRAGQRAAEAVSRLIKEKYV